MYTHCIMKQLQDRREKERHLAINTVVTIRVSKPFALLFVSFPLPFVFLDLPQYP